MDEAYFVPTDMEHPFPVPPLHESNVVGRYILDFHESILNFPVLGG